MLYLLNSAILIWFSSISSLFTNTTIQGEIYNAVTREPIPYVNIWVKAADIRLTSNSEGKFILNSNSSLSRQDTIVFSSIGYKPFLTTVQQLLAEKNLKKVILLHEDIVPLQEVLIRPLTARQIIQNGIDAIPDNHLNGSYQVHGFYRKAIKENNAFAALIESVIHITHPATDKQTRISYLKSRLSKDYRTYKQPLDNNIIANALELDHVQYERGFLNKYHIADWQFKIIGLTKINQQEVYIIQASLLGDKHAAVHQAKIYIRSEDYAFQKIDYDYTWNSSAVKEEAAPGDTIIFKKYNWKGSFNYIPYRGKMVLNYFHFTLKQNIYFKGYLKTAYGQVQNNKLLASQESHEEFIADNIKILSQSLLHKPSSNTSGLAESARLYDEKFWKTYLKPIDSKLFIAVKKDLEKYATFEDLFKTEVN